MDLMQIKIKKDEQSVSYIKLIREYDKSMSMSQIKQKIESNDFVVKYDIKLDVQFLTDLD